jgi:hypothetical protein
MKPEKKVGGLTFLISIPALFVLNCVVLNNLFSVVELAEGDSAYWLLGGVSLGLIIAPAFSKGRVYVFIHEVKHAILASLAGNKWKGMKVGSQNGSFEYVFYKHTAHLNAFIFLAPYWFPIISIPVWLLCLTNWDPQGLKLALGAALGADVYMGLKDMGPHQTDLSRIRGGVLVAKSYILLMTTLVCSLVTIGGILGLIGFKLLGAGILLDLVRVSKAFGLIQ